MCVSERERERERGEGVGEREEEGEHTCSATVLFCNVPTSPESVFYDRDSGVISN